MDPDVLYLLVIAFGSVVIMGIALKVALSLWRASTVFSRWVYCVPAGYAIAVLSWSTLERTHLTGTGGGNLAGWVSMALSAPTRAIANQLNVPISYWFLVMVGLLALTFLGIAIDLVWAAAKRRT